MVVVYESGKFESREEGKKAEGCVAITASWLYTSGTVDQEDDSIFVTAAKAARCNKRH